MWSCRVERDGTYGKGRDGMQVVHVSAKQSQQLISGKRRTVYYHSEPNVSNKELKDQSTHTTRIRFVASAATISL